MQTVTQEAARRPRAYVRVRGTDAGAFLQRMVSNDVLARKSCDALVLTPKGRVVAPLVVWRRGEEDFLLLTEPELGDVVRALLVRMRFAAQCEIEIEEHTSTVVFGGSPDDGGGILNREFGDGGVELLDADLPLTIADDELERRRIMAGTPRFGRELDERVLPAEAGLDATHVSFTKGCFPGQEPVARLNNRGKVNRLLRVLDVEGASPPFDAEIVHAGKVVGRVTSAAPGIALGYVRVEVPPDAELRIGDAAARLHS